MICSEMRNGVKKVNIIFYLAIAVMLLLTGCLVKKAPQNLQLNELTYEGTVELKYATQFSIDCYKEGYRIIRIKNGENYLVVPRGKKVPKKDDDMIVLQQPFNNIYLVSTSVMDFFARLDEVNNVRLTGTKKNDWYIKEAIDALEKGEMIYAGKYNQPDYELIVGEECDLSIQNTMIYHSPETKEKLEEMGIPVFVEQSSLENHPLGRLEWIKVYGILMGKEEEAEIFFNEQLENIEENVKTDDTEKKVAYFYVTSNGAVSVRKSGDYISKMIEMAGGKYVFDDLTDDNALSTINIQMEEFIDKAADADYLIYNSTIDGEISTMDDLLNKCPELKNSKAVKEGNVWCTGKNMFQETTGCSDMILDMYYMMSGEEREFTYLSKLQP